MAVSVVTNDSKMSSEDEQKMMHMMMMRSRSSTKQADNRAREVRSGYQGVMCHVPSFAVAAVLMYSNLLPPFITVLYSYRTVFLHCNTMVPKHYEIQHMVPLQSAKAQGAFQIRP